jgi:hypothetical protein
MSGVFGDDGLSDYSRSYSHTLNNNNKIITNGPRNVRNSRLTQQNVPLLYIHYSLPRGYHQLAN